MSSDLNEPLLTEALTASSAAFAILADMLPQSVIGMDEAADYQDQDISVGPGDVLALYTNVLTESGTDHLLILGIPGLAAHMAGEVQSAAQVMARRVKGSEAYEKAHFAMTFA